MHRSASSSRVDRVCTVVVLAVLFHVAALQSVGKGPNPQGHAPRRHIECCKNPHEMELLYRGPLQGSRGNMESLMGPPPSYCVRFACLICGVIQ